MDVDTSRGENRYRMETERDYPPVSESVRGVRQMIEGRLPDTVPADEVILAASELATNAIVHAKTAFTVRFIRNSSTVRLEFADDSEVVPDLEDLDESQHGLPLVDQVSHRSLR